MVIEARRSFGKRGGWLGLLTAAVVAAWSVGAAAEEVLDVREFGAVGDGETMDTQAIQEAIDEAAARGGGTVRLPEGRFLSGTIYLADGVTLHLDRQATLVGSREADDYATPRQIRRPDGSEEEVRVRALIGGVGLTNVAIRGEGTIDGQGDAFFWGFPRPSPLPVPRPRGIYLIDCRNVLVEGVRMRHAGSWMQHYRFCEGVTIRDIDVFNHATYNNDGLNIDSSRDVTITGCRIDSDDDAIVLKSLSLRPVENVTITDCVVSSHCNALKLGTESGGGFKNVRIADITVHSPRETTAIYGRDRGLAAIALELVDGGRLENVHVSNVDIDGVSAAIFLRLGNRARVYEADAAEPGVGTFRNVVLSDITAVNTGEIGCSITGIPGHQVENVVLRNIDIGFDGGGTREQAEREIPEREEAYPESTMFGVLPAYGFFCRHAKNLVFENLTLRTDTADLRHAMVFDRVEQVSVDGLDASVSEGAAAMLRLSDVRHAAFRGVAVPEAAEVLAQAGGEDTRGVVIGPLDLPESIVPLAADDDLADDAVKVETER